MGWQKFGKAKCRFQHSLRADSSLWATAKLEGGVPLGAEFLGMAQTLINVSNRASGRGDSHTLLPLELMSDRDQVIPWLRAPRN